MKHYRSIRKRCNDQAHYNFFKAMMLNDGELHLNDRLKYISTFSDDLRDILILHLSCIFFLNDHYMMSSDYMDCLECGSEPEPDSQYWVSPVVQKIFDDVITKYRPDITTIIKQNSRMQLV